MSKITEINTHEYEYEYEQFWSTNKNTQIQTGYKNKYLLPPKNTLYFQRQIIPLDGWEKVPQANGTRKQAGTVF